MIGLSVNSSKRAQTGSNTFGEILPDDFAPVKLLDHSVSEPNLDWDGYLTNTRKVQKTFELNLPDRNNAVVANSIPLQIWEGTVKSVNHDDSVMSVILEPKMTQGNRHSADISLEWVSDQDRNLVTSGAVFYLTLYKRTNRGSIQNSQELRFRRKPSWSATQVKNIESKATELKNNFKVLRTAE